MSRTDDPSARNSIHGVGMHLKDPATKNSKSSASGDLEDALASGPRRVVEDFFFSWVSVARCHSNPPYPQVSAGRATTFPGTTRREWVTITGI